VLGTGAALARTSRLAWLRWIASFYIWAIRGTPLLVQILFVYFALPVLVPGLNLPDFAAAVVALGLNAGAYNAEAIRAGLLAVPAARPRPPAPWACPRPMCSWTWCSPRRSRFRCRRW
jgi:polar amino acid transport system permease protein